MAARPARPRPPRIALALGGGGARGLAHIAVLEALDDLGLRPVSITGTSIGAIVGAAYAAGASGKELRRHALTVFRDRTEVMARMFAARVGRIGDLFSQGLGNPLLVDGEIVLDRMLPAKLPATFGDLSIPFRAIATDYYGRSRVVLENGPLRPAVAASMALPWLVRPVRIDGRVLVDGGAVDPLPTRDADPDADIVLAIDVTGGLVYDDDTKFPSPIEGMLGMSSILQAALTEARLAQAPAHVRVIRAPVSEFKILDFFLARRILEACDPLRDQVKEAIFA